MSRVIMSTGRGGAGKSTFVALASRYLALPKLLIDLDPDESLANMLGIYLKEKGRKTISDALYEIIEGDKSIGCTGYDLLPNRLESAIHNDCLYKEARFHLLTLGTKFTAGCYCAPDTVLKDFIPRLAKDYSEIVIDAPAGLEHFNRKIVIDIDDLFVVLDPSDKSVKHIKRIKDITGEMRVSYGHLYLIGNYRFTPEAEEYLRNTGEAYLGKIDYDPEVKEYNLKGKSLLELPENSPALVSVKGILVKAGYSLANPEMEII